MPARAIFEAFGCNVEWKRTKRILVYNDYITLENISDNDIRYLEDLKMVFITTPGKEINNNPEITDNFKIDKTKPIVYQLPIKSSERIFYKSTIAHLKLPIVNLNIPEVKVFNDIIEKKKIEFIGLFSNGYYFFNQEIVLDSIPVRRTQYFSSYTANIRDNVLSVYERDDLYHENPHTCSYNVINIDLQEKRVLNYFEMLERFGLSLDEVKEKIRIDCNSDNEYKAFIKTNEIDNYISNYEKYIYMKDRLFFEDYDPSITLDNYFGKKGINPLYAPTKSYIYINNNGEICTNYPVMNDLVREELVLKK